MKIKSDVLSVILVVFALIILGMFIFYAPDAGIDFGQVEVDIGYIEVTDSSLSSQVEVYIENSEPGFISIHESMGEAPGEVIGVSEYFYNGSYDYSIDLIRDMISGQTYIALLHIDDGDKIFDIQKDMPVSVDGEVSRADFEFLIESEE